MTDLKGKRVLIFQQRAWGTGIGHHLAKHLQDEGCVLAALTLKRSTDAAVRQQKEVRYERIVNHDEIMSDPKAFLGGANITLTEVCADLGIDSVWPFVMCLRNMVRSYGEKFYYGFTPNLSDDEIAAYVKALHVCIKQYFEVFKPDIILAPNFVGLVHIMFNLYAMKRGVPMLAVTDSKVRGVNIFCYDYRDTNPLLQARLAELDAGATSPNAERARAYVESQRKNFMHPATFIDPNAKIPFIKRLRAEVAPYRDIVKWYVKRPVNLLKNIGITADYRPPRIILRDHYAMKSYRRFMNHFAYDPLPTNQKFAYFPLQFQPEETIDVKAPFFNNQIETARQVAMSMPDDFTLVVKEHPGMVGYRPPSYIKKVARLVNVRFIDYRTPTNEVMKYASLVISPNSTSISEAAYFNIPAIQLGMLATTTLLPNVVRHTDMTTLASAIRDVLKMDMHTPAFRRRLQNFVAAVYDTGFELEYVKIWETEGKDEALMSKLWQIYRSDIIRLLTV